MIYLESYYNVIYYHIIYIYIPKPSKYHKLSIRSMFRHWKDFWLWSPRLPIFVERCEAGHFDLGMGIECALRWWSGCRPVNWFKGESILVGGIPTPLKNISWDDEIPNIYIYIYMEKIIYRKPCFPIIGLRGFLSISPYIYWANRDASLRNLCFKTLVS